MAYPYQPYTTAPYTNWPNIAPTMPVPTITTTTPTFSNTTAQSPGLLYGKLIGSIDEVTALDVAMNGMPSVFPMKDESAIYLKIWQPDGTIRTIKFVPESDEKKANNNADGCPDETFKMRSKSEEIDEDRLNKIELELHKALTKMEELNSQIAAIQSKTRKAKQSNPQISLEVKNDD